MSCTPGTRTMLLSCLLSLSAYALAANSPACNDATCQTDKSKSPMDIEYVDELSGEDVGMQFVQKRSLSKRVMSTEEVGETEYALVGDGACLDNTASHGTENLRYIMSKNKSSPHTSCQKFCSKSESCTGYDDREEGCVFYKIAIHDSGKSTSLYQCYKKVISKGEIVVDVDENSKNEGDDTAAEGCIAFNYNPAEEFRSYSSVYGDDEPGSGNARSMLQVKAAWRANVDEAGQYMILDMGRVTKVKGVLVQPRGKKSYEYVKIYSVEYSENGTTWKEVEGRFVGSALTAPAEGIFPAAVLAQYIKIIPLQWNTHISMRAGAILCEDAPSMMMRVAVKPGSSYPKKDKCSFVTLNPAESLRTYSSTYWDDPAGIGHAESMLDSAQAWTAKENKEGEYMIMDLGSPCLVRGILTQSRMDRPWEYVKKYNVEYSIDGVEWTDEGELLTSSNSYDRKREAKFSKMVEARYLKLVVKTWKSKISMRAGAVVCAPVK